MSFAFITIADLEARVSRSVLRQCTDDNDNGQADTAVLEKLIRDGSSKVASYLNDLPVSLSSPYPSEIVRLTTDVCEAMLAMRHPEYVKRNGLKLMKAAESDLEKLRAGKTSLEKATPQGQATIANQGAYVASSTGELPEPVFRRMGDF